MKTYTFFRHHAALRLGSLAIAACGMAMFMNSCQDEDFGYTKEEIAYSATVRHYNDAFVREFGQPDSNHDWSYTPVPTFVTDNGNGNVAGTRAVTAPVVDKSYANIVDSCLRIEADLVDNILEYMREGNGNGESNASKITSNFEYYAVTETTYDIWPVLWGEKFVKENYIGIYTVEDGKWVDRGILWSDTYENVLMGYKEQTQNIKNSTRPVNRDTSKDWSDKTLPTMDYVKSTTECDVCHGTGEVTQKCNAKVNQTGWWPNRYSCSSCGHEYTESEYNRLGNQHKCTQMINVECTTCNGTGTKKQVDKVNPEYYLFPHYKVTMPAGTTWGIYLKTRKHQDYTPTVIWCSNPAYNDGNDSGDLDRIVKSTIAAGTFTYGGVTYCCFEDAPLNYGNTYKSYDHDYNDFMLRITPRPVESTYKSESVRIMCEDLGGTFDWDFNDIVYDLQYVEGTYTGASTTVKIILQAVGGTLPIHMYYNGEDLGDLHAKYAGQSLNDKGLYDYVTIKMNKTIHTVDLGDMKFENFSFADIVKNISIKVADEYYPATRANEGAVITESHVINFPDQGGDKMPQCFMTSIGTEWSDELVNIVDTYPEFAKWVQNPGEYTNWWDKKY